jgi:hypothetical protein
MCDIKFENAPEDWGNIDYGSNPQVRAALDANNFHVSTPHRQKYWRGLTDECRLALLRPSSRHS